MKQPRTLTELCPFIGNCNIYQRIIYNYFRNSGPAKSTPYRMTATKLIFAVWSHAHACNAPVSAISLPQISLQDNGYYIFLIN